MKTIFEQPRMIITDRRDNIPFHTVTHSKLFKKNKIRKWFNEKTFKNQKKWSKINEKNNFFFVKKNSDSKVAPSFSCVVRFLCTVGIAFDRADLMTPIDNDFRGRSTASSELCVPFRVCGQINCRRYSVLNFEKVFLKIPLDSPAWNEIEMMEKNC